MTPTSRATGPEGLATPSPTHPGQSTPSSLQGPPMPNDPGTRAKGPRVGAKRQDPLTAIAYVRVSTDDQRLGPEAQAAALQAYAQAHGITIAEWCTDLGVSGAAPIASRPGLTRALLAMREHRAASLLVAKRDRLARDVLVAAMVDRALPKGARIVSADGTGNGDSAGDAFMRTVIDGAAAYERDLIRARTKAALQAKRARGERAGAVPFGFAADPLGRLTPEAREQATIALVRDLQASGHSHRGIMRALQASGCTSRKGTPLGLAQVQRILQGLA